MTLNQTMSCLCNTCCDMELNFFHLIGNPDRGLPFCYMLLNSRQARGVQYLIWGSIITRSHDWKLRIFSGYYQLTDILLPCSSTYLSFASCLKDCTSASLLNIQCFNWLLVANILLTLINKQRALTENIWFYKEKQT